MTDIEDRRQPAEPMARTARVEAEAVGFVLAQVLRPIVMEPLPWAQVDLLRALRRAERSGVSAGLDEQASDSRPLL